ncbi:MAG: translocation/assembly module TamB domain-containing protein [Prolixibacteraceae bacterium]|nr:translocation/assembly module TamB domain-containing protein [Prolixibacteraceae bacterium]
MRKVGKYSLLVLVWLLAAIILLTIVTGLLIQTRPVKNRLAVIAENKASELVNGKISVGEIDGNFFTSLVLKNVLWMNESDTLAFIEEINAGYRLRPLLRSELLIQHVQISKPYFYLKQNSDSTWNVQNLVEPEESTKSSGESSGSLNVKIANFEIFEGRLKINAIDTVIPQEVNHLNLKLSFGYSQEKQNLELNTLSFNTLKPLLVLEQLSLTAQRNQQEIQLRNLYVKTAQNLLEGEADYTHDTLLNASARLKSEPLHLNEFEFFIPGVTLPATPTLDVKTEVKNGAFNAGIKVADENQNINLEIYSENFGLFLDNPSKTRLKYQVNGVLQNIDLAHWLGDPQLKYLVNGQLEIKGEGIDPKTASVALDADFRDIIIHEKPVDKLQASLNLNNGNLDGKVEGEGNFGLINITPEIRNLQNNPAYRLDVVAQNFNVAEITGNDTLQSDINLFAKIEGESFDPQKINASANIKFSESRFQQMILDTLFAQAQYQGKNIQIDSLRAETQTALLSVSGNYNLNGASDIMLHARFSGLEEWAQFIPAEKIFAEGELDAHLKGMPDSLDVEAKINLKNVLYDDFTSEKLLVNASGQLTSSDTVAHARISAGNFRTGKLVIDSANFELDYLRDSLFVDGRAEGEDVKTQLAAGVSLGKQLRITMQNWNTDYKNQHFSLQNPPAVFELDSTHYKISNFKLVSNDSDTAQFIAANGIISRTGEEDFQLELANINIQQLLEMFQIEFEASGILDVNAELKGTAENPLLNADFMVNKAILNEFELTDFSGNFGFQNNTLNADVSIIPLDSGKLELKGEFPMLAKLDSMKFDFDTKDSLQATLAVDRFPLAILQQIEIAREIKGFLEGTVEVGGTLEAPDPSGNFHLVEASLAVPAYGINYENIAFNLQFLPEAVQLDSFFIKSEDGTMKASGTIDFNSAFYKGDVSESEINVAFKNFNPVNHRQFNMQLSGDANVKGKKGEVVFGGNLTVPESELYLPAIFNMMGKYSVPEIPASILIREMQKTELYRDSLAFQVDTLQTDSLHFSYLDNFTGTLNLKIPKNSWIKNKDMHIEISGDLELRKNEDFFELFGSVDVVRGQYDLLGKTFIIDNGTISFQGGEELQPRIDITASYSFRNPDRAEQELTVQVSGTAEEPAVNFSLDGASVSEGDALSYILFGRSMDELSIDQQQNVEGAGSLAGTAAAAILSSQITDLLGEKLDVDYIEIKSDGDFDNATVVVGKYITNDLFVSYEQRFGETREKEMAKYEVKLEYELFKFLFLQLNNSSNDSGFDVIFKLNSK